MATRTREVLTRFGADPDLASVDEAAARVAASRVRERIVSALDRLLLWADVAAPVTKRAGVRALLRRVDADRYRDAVRDAILAEDRAKIVELVGQKAALEQPSGFVAFLGESPAIVVERRRQLLRSAVSRRSGDLGLLMALGSTYPVNDTKGVDEPLRWFQAAVAAAPANAAAHTNLGNALYSRASGTRPSPASARPSNSTRSSPRPTPTWAMRCIPRASWTRPSPATARPSNSTRSSPRPTSNLGNALTRRARWTRPSPAYKKAIELDPKLATAHSNLGNALYSKGQWDEAIACFRKAIELDPKLAAAHTNLGNALKQKGQLDEAIACFQKAIELDPKFATAHNNLGNALIGQGPVGRGHRLLPQGHRTRPEERRGPQQPGHCAVCQGPVGRGHRLLPQGHRTRPEARHGPQQPGQCAEDRRASWTRPSPATARPSNSTRSSPRPTTTWAMRCMPRASGTRPSPASARPSNSTRSSPRPTPTWAVR